MTYPATHYYETEDGEDREQDLMFDDEDQFNAWLFCCEKINVFWARWEREGKSLQIFWSESRRLIEKYGKHRYPEDMLKNLKKAEKILKINGTETPIIASECDIMFGGWKKLGNP